MPCRVILFLINATANRSIHTIYRCLLDCKRDSLLRFVNIGLIRAFAVKYAMCVQLKVNAVAMFQH